MENGQLYPDNQAPPPGDFLKLFPGLWPLTGQDLIRVRISNTAAGVTVTVSLRTVNQTGMVQRQVFTLIPATDGSIAPQDFPVGDGALVDVTAEATAGAPLYGQCYALIQLIVGLGGEKQRVSTVAQGCVTATQPIFGPSQSALPAVDGAGAVRSVTQAAPGAGAEISITVPAAVRWEVLSVAFNLVTAVAAANRVVNLTIDDGANIYFRDSPAVVQAASLTDNYSFAEGVSKLAAPVVTAIMGNLPGGNRLLAGHRIRTLTTAIQGADQYSAAQLLVRQWPEV